MKQQLMINGALQTIKIISQLNDNVEFMYQGETYHYTMQQHYHSHFILREQSGELIRGTMHKNTITLDGYDHHISEVARGASAIPSSDTLPIAPMPGMIQSVLVKVGDVVTKDQPLVVMEAMKMQLTIKATRDGVIGAVNVKVGDAVAKGALLIALNESTDV
jgi:3-methylcrotonyl-CoA carboxylase alpha subunit